MKIELIQAMRGVAALMVVLYHLTTNARDKFGEDFLGGVFLFGYAGVDFFFFLSGFIIYYVHHRDLGNASRIGPYLVKRAIRIYPIYWMVTLAILPAYFLFPQFGNGYERDADVIVKSLLLMPQPHNPILTVAWSLVHEVLFYLLFALAIAVGRRSAGVLCAAWAIGCIVVSDNYFFSMYNLEFMVGLVLAHIFLETGERMDMKVPRFAVVLGDASYSIYLVHSIVIALLIKSGATSMWVIGCAAVAAGVAMHLLIERPLLEMLRRAIHAGVSPTTRTSP